MSDEKVFSLNDLLSADADSTAYDVIPAYGGQLQIGSLCSADMIEWLESNENPAMQREAGLRLLIKSIVLDGFPVRDDGGKVVTIKGGTRVPAETFEAALVSFRKKDARANGAVINQILALNGIGAKKAEGKNGSGEANTGASPTDLPSPQGT